PLGQKVVRRQPELQRPGFRPRSLVRPFRPRPERPGHHGPRIGPVEGLRLRRDGKRVRRHGGDRWAQRARIRRPPLERERGQATRGTYPGVLTWRVRQPSLLKSRRHVADSTWMPGTVLCPWHPAISKAIRQRLDGFHSPRTTLLDTL